jgi:hypothetical protein
LVKKARLSLLHNHTKSYTLPGGNHAGYRNYWNTVFSIAIQNRVANKMLACKYRRIQHKNYKSSGGCPIGNVEYLTDLGEYRNTRVVSGGRGIEKIFFTYQYG